MGEVSTIIFQYYKSWELIFSLVQLRGSAKKIKMKILLVNTPKSLEFRGGDLTQMQETGAELKKLGVQVEESFEREPDGRGFDLAHVFNLRTIDVTSRQVGHLKSLGLPVVLSPIYLNPSFPLWATRVIKNIFGSSPAPEKLSQLLTNLQNYDLKVKCANGQMFSAEGKNRPRADYDQKQREILANVDYLLPNSLLEMDQLVKSLRMGNIPFSVVPYAASPEVFLNADPEVFIKQYGLRDFVLQVGRLERSKNQLLLCYALRELDVPLVLIGGNFQKEYLQWCQQYGPKNLTVIPHIPHEVLRSAYAAARVHALPSWVETCGLVTMEAALANCNVVASIVGYEREYYRDLAYYCDPSNVNDIRLAVFNALENYDRDLLRRQQLKELILKNYTWERAAEITLRAYERVLSLK